MDTSTCNEETWAARELYDERRDAEGSERDRIEGLMRSMANRLRAQYGSDDRDVNYIIDNYLR